MKITRDETFRAPDADRKIFADIINENPGNDKTFECKCGKTYITSNAVPPVIICPECGQIIKLLRSGRTK